MKMFSICIIKMHSSLPFICRVIICSDSNYTINYGHRRTITQRNSYVIIISLALGKLLFSLYLSVDHFHD